MTLTYNPNTSGTLHAAYCGDCRIGYVEARAHNRHRWQLSLVQAGGNYAFGVEDDDEAARAELQHAFDYWLACAGLTQKPNLNDQFVMMSQKVYDMLKPTGETDADPSPTRRYSGRTGVLVRGGQARTTGSDGDGPRPTKPRARRAE